MSESTNLAESEPGKVEELAAKLAAWRKDVDAQMPTPNPAYAPNAQLAERHDQAAGQHRRGPRRDAPVRAATAQEHPWLLGPRRRLGVVGIRRHEARNVRGYGTDRLRQWQRWKHCRVPGGRSRRSSSPSR